MTHVLDASVVVAALVDAGPEGRWAESPLVGDDLAAPHLLPVEVANILRRAALSGAVSPDVAAMAHSDMAALRVSLYADEPFANRVWELRATVTAYDACHVALAEALGAELATMDLRLAGATGHRCAFRTPPT